MSTALKGKREACLKHGLKYHVTAFSEGAKSSVHAAVVACLSATSFSRLAFLHTRVHTRFSNPAPTHISWPRSWSFPSSQPGVPSQGCLPRGTHSSSHRLKPAAEVHLQPYGKNHSWPNDNGSRFLLIFCTLLPQSSSILLKNLPAGRRQLPGLGCSPQPPAPRGENPSLGAAAQLRSPGAGRAGVVLGGSASAAEGLRRASPSPQPPGTSPGRRDGKLRRYSGGPRCPGRGVTHTKTPKSRIRMPISIASSLMVGPGGLRQPRAAASHSPLGAGGTGGLQLAPAARGSPARSCPAPAILPGRLTEGSEERRRRPLTGPSRGRVPVTNAACPRAGAAGGGILGISSPRLRLRRGPRLAAVPPRHVSELRRCCPGGSPQAQPPGGSTAEASRCASQANGCAPEKTEPKKIGGKRV